MTAKSIKDSSDIFRVTGSYKKGQRLQKFAKEILVPNKIQAQEYIYSIIGSKHRVKRREITIEKIEKITLADATDPVIKQIAGGK